MKKLLLLIIAASCAAVAQVPFLNFDVQAARLRLTAYAGSETIPNTMHGMGWDNLGRFTIQTPVGAWQFYLTGLPTPSVPTVYWPGTMVADRIESTSIIGTIGAASITSGTGGGETINATLIGNSLPLPLQIWVPTEAQMGAAGVPFANTAPLGGSEPSVPGFYWPRLQVIDSVSDPNYTEARWRTSEQLRADLALPEIVAVPATATSAGTAGQIAYDASWLYVCVATNTWRRVALSSW